MCKDKKEPCKECGCSINESRSPHDTPVEKFVKKLGIGPGLMVKFHNDPIEYIVKNLSANPERVFVYNPNDRIDPNRIYNKDVKKIVMSNRKPVDFNTMSLPEIRLVDVKLISKEEAFPEQYPSIAERYIKALEALVRKKVVLQKDTKEILKDIKYALRDLGMVFRKTDLTETEPYLYASICKDIDKYKEDKAARELSREELEQYYKNFKGWRQAVDAVLLQRSMK